MNFFELFVIYVLILEIIIYTTESEFIIFLLGLEIQRVIFFVDHCVDLQQLII